MKFVRLAGLILLILVAIAVALAFLLRPDYRTSDLRPYTSPHFLAELEPAHSYSAFSRQSTYITLADGTRLAADILLPDDRIESSSNADSASRYPTILEYGPYSRAYVELGLSPWQRVIGWWATGRTEPLWDATRLINVRNLLHRGYALVIVEMRGTGASFGFQAPLEPQLGLDGAEVVEWIAAQPWSDGNVGMRGQSYVAWGAFATAAHAPKALKCIAPGVIAFESYSDAVRPGGITAKRWLRGYSDALRSSNLNELDPASGQYPAAPVVDEDGDGRVADEVPLYSTHDPKSFLDDLPIRYADGRTRPENLLYKATVEHQKNTLVEQFLDARTRYFDQPFPAGDKTMRYLDTSTGAILEAIIERKIPVLNTGGWFDIFAKATPKLHATLHGNSPSYLHMGPNFHGADISAAYRAFLSYPGVPYADVLAQQFRFFDWCLKGHDNGFAEQPPVSIYVVNKGWRTESAWPLENERRTDYYFGSGNSLSSEAGAAGIDTYDVDFGHRSDYGTNNSNRWETIDEPDSLMLRNEPDRKAILFESPQLAEGIEVTGHPIMRLWVSADRDDADVFVYLSDIDRNGDAHYVAEGQLRASFHTLVDPSLQTGGSTEVRPILPWHGFRAQDEDPAPFANDRVLELTIELTPIAWYFAPGHRIRVSLAGADLGNFELNPTLCPGDDVGNCQPTRLTIHRGAATPSAINLPVIK
jgi:putative CocE/NonD family hydrolase